MLFHLKEPNYKTDAPHDPIVRFYGRNPKQIINTIEYYRERVKKDGVDMDRPDLVYWLKRKFSDEDIEHVKKGEFIFFTGMISFAEEDKHKNLFEEIKVSEDFSVYVPEENIGNFSLYRTDLSNSKRGELHKLHCSAVLFKNTSYVPKDIIDSILKYDLTNYKEAIQKDIIKIAKLSRHPNVKVDGLQRILESQTQVKNRRN
ncbi:MAG: hypothetical protein AABY22_25225 [Nanoarchaeota archaeon]